MTAQSVIQVSPEMLVQIVGSVFETMLSLEAEPSDDIWFAAPDRITSAVHLAGAWNGAVIVECNHQQACLFAGRFLSIDTPPRVDEDVRDVLGELANMIGGNLKCVLCGGIHLSMPAVVDGSDYSLRICGADVRARLSFRSGGSPFWVTILTNNVH